MGIRPLLPFKKKQELILAKVPAEFLRVVNINYQVKGFKKKNDYLRELARELRPSVDELRKIGFVRDEEDYLDKR